jgi:hypothetical protein
MQLQQSSTLLMVVAANVLALAVNSALASGTAHLQHRSDARKECVVTPSHGVADDAIAVEAAFQECGTYGRVIFQNETYYINSTMNTTGLNDVEIEHHGTLLVNPFLLESCLAREYQAVH